MTMADSVGQPAGVSSMHAQHGPREFVVDTTTVFVDDRSAQRSTRRYAMSHTQNSRSSEEKIPLERVSPRSGVTSYADGFSENPLNGSPAKTFAPFKKDIEAGVLQVPTAVYGGDLSFLASQSCASLIERPAQCTAVRKPTRSMANKLSAEALRVFQTNKQQSARRGQSGQPLPTTLRPGWKNSLQISVENPLPVWRDTHKMVVGGEDGQNGIAGTAPSKNSKGKSTSVVNAAPHPPLTEHSQKAKSYVPSFLKPSAKHTHHHRPTHQGVDANAPAKSAKQGKAAIPAFLKPGWGEAPRKPPTIGKNHSGALSSTNIGQYHDELHLGESVSDTSTSEKVKNMRRAWSRRWKKHNGQKQEVHALNAVALAQSGPASIVGGAVFPPDIVVTSSSGTPYQAGQFLGDAKVSVNDLPSMLRLGHAKNGMDSQQEEASPTYKWPFVDMTNELFLNYDPKKDNGANGRTRGLKHQEPRIVDMGLPTNGLEAEVLQDLAKRELGNRKRQSRVVSPDGLEINIESESPISPFSAEFSRIGVAKEMAIGGSGLTTFKAREVHVGARNKSLGTEMADIRTPEPPLPMGPIAGQSTPVVPKATQDQQAKDTDQPDFSWFRFSRVDLEDPADQHCRDYRTRRREMRRSKQETLLAHV